MRESSEAAAAAVVSHTTPPSNDWKGGGGGGALAKNAVANDAVPSPSSDPLPLRQPRTLDEFLEEACANNNNSSPSFHPCCSSYNNTRNPWRYWLMYVSLGVANSSDAAEILCLSYILSVDNFQATMLHSSNTDSTDTTTAAVSSWRSGLLAATVFFGMLLGGLVVGALGDWWGRRPMLVTALAVNAVAGLLSAAAWNVYSLCLCRFVAGLGVGATVPPLFSLASELAPPSARGFWVTMVASYWMVGSMYVAVLGWLILGHASSNDSSDTDGGSSVPWRIFAASCALPSCLGCLCVSFCVPESPRFLLLNRQFDHALYVIQQLSDSLEYAGPPMTREELVVHYPIENPVTLLAQMDSEKNAYNEPDFEMSNEMCATSNDDAVARRSRLSNGTINLHRPASSVLAYNLLCTALRDFTTSASRLYTPSLCSTTWPLQLLWFSLSFGSYGLMTWINTLFKEVHLENVYFNALLFSASNLPGNLLAAYLMDRTGRVSLLTGSVLTAAAALVAFAYFAGKQTELEDDNGLYSPAQTNNANKVDHSVATGIVLSACLFQCFTIAAWNAIDVLTSELFPTSVRSTGMGVCAATGRIGAMIAQFVNGALVTSHPVRLLWTAAATLVLGSVVAPCFLPLDVTGQPVADYDTSVGNVQDAVFSSGNTQKATSGNLTIYSTLSIVDDNNTNNSMVSLSGRQRDGTPNHRGSGYESVYRD